MCVEQPRTTKQPTLKSAAKTKSLQVQLSLGPLGIRGNSTALQIRWKVTVSVIIRAENQNPRDDGLVLRCAILGSRRSRSELSRKLVGRRDDSTRVRPYANMNAHEGENQYSKCPFQNGKSLQSCSATSDKRNQLRLIRIGRNFLN
jgi:hypothetical protein